MAISRAMLAGERDAATRFDFAHNVADRGGRALIVHRANLSF